MNGLAVAVTVLGELAVLLLAVGVFLGLRWQKARDRVRALESKLSCSRRDSASYAAQIRDAVSGLIGVHRQRYGSGAEVLHTSASLRRPIAPEQLVLQLRYEVLRGEQKLLEVLGQEDDYWAARGRLAVELGQAFAAGEEGLRQWWAAQQRRHSEALSKERHQQGDAAQTLRRKLQRREQSLERLERRAAELEAYRERFNALHGEVLAERKANEELRRQLRERASAAVDAPLRAYEQQRDQLERYLEQGDIQPFAERHQGRLPQPSREHQARRQRQLLEASGGRLNARQRVLRSSLARQRAIAEELRQRLEQAEEREERVKIYYRQKMRQLQQELEASRSSADDLEKEIARSRRSSSRLLQRMERQEQERTANASLEQALDRFAAQAIEMQHRIQELEQEVAEAHRENLGLKDRLELLTDAETATETELPPKVSGEEALDESGREWGQHAAGR